MKKAILIGLPLTLILLVLLYFNGSDPSLTRGYHYSKEYGLYIQGEPSGCGHTRFTKVDFIDWNARYMIVVKDSEWYLLDMNKDSCLLNAEEIVRGPLTVSQVKSYYRDEIHLRYIDDLIGE
jgi:hypothetical protein